MDNLLRYCLCWAFLVSPLAFSADRVVVVEPSQLQKTYTPGSGAYAFNDSRSWAEPVSVQSGKVNLPVKTDRKFSWATFRNGLKNALKVNPASIALNGTVAAALAGVGYLMNEGAVSKKTSDGPPVSPTQYYWESTAYSAVGSKYSSLSAAHDAAVASRASTYGCPGGAACSQRIIEKGRIDTINANPKIFRLWVKETYIPTGAVAEAASMQVQEKGSCPSPYVYSNNSCYVNSPTYAPISDVEFDDLVGGFSSPSDAVNIVPDVISAVPGSYDYHDGFEFSGPPSLQGDPVTTTTTTPTGTEVSTTTPSYTFDYSSSPMSITTTTNSTTTVYNNGTLVSTTNTTNAGTVNPVEPVKPLEIPTDCEFMPTVCAWLDWFKSPAPPPNDPALPEITDSFEKSYSGPSLSATCPAPFTINTGAFGSILMPVQPLCDLAGLIKYLVLSAAGLLAAFIISGTRRA